MESRPSEARRDRLARVELRRAQLEDAASLGEQMKVVRDEGPWLATKSDRTADELAAMFRSAIEDGHIVYALTDNGRIVGGIGAHHTDTEGVLNLGMYVLAEYRGQGWGRKMVKAVLEAAKAEGARKVELEVFTDNGAAIALYVGSGFEVEGLKRDHESRPDGSLRSLLLMARFLT